MALEIGQKLPSYQKRSARDRHRSFALTGKLGCHSEQLPAEMLGVAGGRNRDHRPSLRDPARDGKNGRPSEAVSNQQLRRLESTAQELGGCQEVLEVGGEIRPGKLPATLSEAREIEPADRDSSSRQSTTDSNDCFVILRAGKAMSKERESPDRSSGNLETGRNRVTVCSGKLNSLCLDPCHTRPPSSSVLLQDFTAYTRISDAGDPGRIKKLFPVE